ncbi:MAG: hypothetical protein MJE68_07445 [Proteobacteria bacterium]|nr:hypothetical protein [Pseudomonadota bacterium]
MPKKSKKPDEKYNFIPVDDDIAEWRKDPEYVKAYESMADEFAEFDRECDAHVARQKRRKAVLAWVRAVGAKLRGVWAYLTTGLSRRVL